MDSLNMKIKDTDHILVYILKKLDTEKHSDEKLFIVFYLLNYLSTFGISVDFLLYLFIIQNGNSIIHNR